MIDSVPDSGQWSCFHTVLFAARNVCSNSVFAQITLLQIMNFVDFTNPR